MTENVEGGMRDYRIEFIRESSFAEPGTDPEYLKYSPVINTFAWEAESEPATRRAIGSADPVEFQKASESHTFTIEYDMTKWFTENSGDAYDAAYDGLARDADNQLPNSHTIVSRESKTTVPEEHTVDGGANSAGSKGTHIYSVGRGGLIDAGTILGEAEETAIATVELEYLVHKARSYQIDQPDTATEVAVQSTDANDTTQSVTIEDEGAGTSTTLSLDGTTVVDSGTDTFESIDAFWLDAETDGDVELYVYDTGGSSTAEQLSVIHGKDSYDGGEGDRGVPALGSGSRETLGADPTYQSFIGDNISRDGTTFKHDISSAALVVENEIEEMEVTKSYGMQLYPTSRALTMEATMFSENATHELLMDNLRVDSADVDWTLEGGTVTLTDAVLSEPGEREVEESQAVMTTENVFTGKGLTITES